MTSLEEKIKELASKVEESHKDGRIPADYSLGFLNGLVLANHLLGGGKGEPRYYDRTTSIGVLPKPMALRSGSALKDEQTFQQLLDELILAIRNNRPGMRWPVLQALHRLDEFSNNRIGDMVDAFNRQNPSSASVALSLVPRLAGRGSDQGDGPDGEDSQSSNPLA